MAYVSRTIIVIAALQPLARALIVAQAGEAQAGILTVALSAAADPAGPAVAFIASGAIDESFAGLLVDAEALFAAVSALGAPVTLPQCQALIGSSTVVDVDQEPALATIARLGYALKT